MRNPRDLRIQFLIPIALVALAFIACSDDATEPVVEDFSLQMQVSTPDGSPVEGLTVVTWNLSSSLKQLLQDNILKRRAATRVQFTLPERCICTMTSYDLEGKVVQSVLEADTLAAGVHQIVLGANVDYNSGVKVMRYELVAQDLESREEIFRDTKYMTAVHLDPARLMNGTTDADGEYTTDDRTIVPGLYDLGEMPSTNENGELQASFTLNDSLIIRLYDDKGDYMHIERQVVDGTNVIQATWDPVSRKQDFAQLSAGDEPAIPMQGLLSRDVPRPPTEFELRQNFPNPFN